MIPSSESAHGPATQGYFCGRQIGRACQILRPSHSPVVLEDPAHLLALLVVSTNLLLMMYRILTPLPRTQLVSEDAVMTDTEVGRVYKTGT